MFRNFVLISIIIFCAVEEIFCDHKSTEHVWLYPINKISLGKMLILSQYVINYVEYYIYFFKDICANLQF